MTYRFALMGVALCVSLAACRAGAPVPTGPYGSGASNDRPEGSATVVEPRTPEGAAVVAPPAAPRKQFKLSTASAALVNQAHTQHKAGNAAVATATLERALRIEPNNPLLWLELARQNQDDGNPGQADSMARKALQLGIGDPQVQSAAWQLIAQSLRTRGRNQEAAEADRKASLATG